MLDEAHVLSIWGRFRPALSGVGPLMNSVRSTNREATVPILALTATASQMGAVAIAASLGMDGGWQQVRAATDRCELRYCGVDVSDIDASGTALLVAALHRVVQHAAMHKALNKVAGIVYVTLPATTVTIANELRLLGVNARPFHGTLKDDERQRVLHEWMTTAGTWLVSTSAGSYGLNNLDIEAIDQRRVDQGSYEWAWVNSGGTRAMILKHSHPGRHPAVRAERRRRRNPGRRPRRALGSGGARRGNKLPVHFCMAPSPPA